MANQLPYVFTDVTKVTKSYIQATNTLLTKSYIQAINILLTKSYIQATNILLRVIVPTEQVIKSIVEELSIAYLKHGRVLGLKGTSLWIRKIKY